MSPAPDPGLCLNMERPPLQEDGRLRIGNASRGGLVATNVRVLRTRWQRARMAWWRNLGEHEALFLSQAPAIHSLGARHGFRVLFLNEDDRVASEAILLAWRNLEAPANASTVLMLHEKNQARVAAGDKLEWLVRQPRVEGRADWLVEGQPPEAWE